MIEIHILIDHDTELKEELCNMSSDDFDIVTILSTKEHYIFWAKTTVEHYAFLVLKYGQQNVWKR